MDWQKVIGCNPDEFCDRLYATRPDWIRGAISHYDARYLFCRALEAGTGTAIEIGTASGLSTAFLCHALRFAAETGLISSDFRVVSYDISPVFYVDDSRSVGDATRDMLDPTLLEHVVFRNPAGAREVAAEHAPDSIEFMFIDANHAHPWPTLDMLTSLECLAPGAEVVLHDVGLPARGGAHAEAGAMYLFSGLSVEKVLDEGDKSPNIGSVVVPDDKQEFRVELQRIVAAHEWETEVRPGVVGSLLQA
jgi:predicted O-methyltransferase YrrM